MQQLLCLEEDVRNKAIDLRGLTAGSLRVGTFSSAAIHLLPQILSRFQERYPGVEVSVLNGDYAAVETALVNNTIDAGFVTLPSRDEFTIFPLFSDRLLAVVDAENPLGKATVLELQDLKDQTFIVPAEGSNYDIGKLFAQADVYPQKWLNINDDYAAIVMVRRKLGVTILPELLVRELPMRGLRAIPLHGSERQIGLAAHHSRFLSPCRPGVLGVHPGCAGAGRTPMTMPRKTITRPEILSGFWPSDCFATCCTGCCSCSILT